MPKLLIRLKHFSHRYDNHHKLSALVCYILMVSSLLLTACQDNVTQPEQPSLGKQSNQYCQLQKSPFTYSFCQVSQKKLLTNDRISLQLFWRMGNDNTNRTVQPLYTFDRLLNQISNDSTLIFAVNGGMYNRDYAPIGYTMINGKQILSLNLNEGAGNFHLMPNGVFWWDDDGYHITDSQHMAELLKSDTKPTYATQSGPMLVINGKIHPQFHSDSTSKKLRNGIGVCDDGNVKLVNSNTAVNFYDFASLFKDELGCNNALFLDGGIASAMYAPEINHKDSKNMGVIIGLVKKSQK